MFPICRKLVYSSLFLELRVTFFKKWKSRPRSKLRVRRFSGLFWPILDFFSGGNINIAYITPRKKIENWLKRTRKSTEPKFRTRSNVSFTALFIALCSLLIPVIDKSLPIVRAKESFRAVFSQERFQARFNTPIPQWMEEQIERDFQDFKGVKIGALALEKTHAQIRQRIKEKNSFRRYRILDNKLYVFVPEDTPFSYTDTSFEKAFKTLLTFAKIPDVDFILCSMDGLPEPYLPPGFYLLDDARDQAPILAQAKLQTPLAKYVVLIPDQFSLHQEWSCIAKEILELNQQIPWEQKKEMAIWRGGLTDTGFINQVFVSDISSCPRFILCKQSLSSPFFVDAGLNWVDKIMELTVQKEGIIKGALSKKDHLLGKYLPVMDGHMCTYPGFQWRLLSNSVSLKQESDQVQWFYGALKPYTHYIPIQNDMGDLLEKIQWGIEHDQEVREISVQAQDFAVNNLMFEDNYFYLYLVLKKLASVEEIDFRKIKKETKRDPRWKCIQYRKRLALKKSLNLRF
jgi:hypothetical protein